MPLLYSPEALIALEAQKAVTIEKYRTDRAKIRAMNWLGERVPELEPHLRDAECSAVRENGGSGDIYVVHIKIQGPRGYQYFSFEVNLEPGAGTVKKR